MYLALPESTPRGLGAAWNLLCLHAAPSPGLCSALTRGSDGAGSNRCRVPAVMTQAAQSPRSADIRLLHVRAEFRRQSRKQAVPSPRSVDSSNTLVAVPSQCAPETRRQRRIQVVQSHSCVDSGSAESTKRRAQAAAPSQGAAESKRWGRIKSAQRPSGDDSRTAECTQRRVHAAAPTRRCRDQAAAQNPRELGQSPGRADSGGFLSELHR